MTANSTLRQSVLLVSCLTLACAAGCKDTGPKNTEFFVADEVHSVDTTLERQAANGARHDGMLTEKHFDGPRLNALGRAKLDRMLLANLSPMTVYVVDPHLTTEHRDAILAYAKDHGRSESDLTIINGINPATLHAASPDLQRLSKTELGKTDDNQGSNTNDTNAAGAPGMSGNNSTGLTGSTNKQGG